MSDESPGIGPHPRVVESSEFTWKGAQALRRVHALNDRCLEFLGQLARSDRGRVSLEIVNQHRNLWRNLSGTARKRAAATPFLLVDVHFQDASWWQWARATRASGRRAMASHPPFAGRITSELMRETLMLAWSSAAFDRGAASVLLGMTPVVAGVISELGPQDVERITARHSRHLRPRWDDFPIIWGRLLRAARDGDEDALHEVRLHGIQLLGSELLPAMDGRLASSPSTHWPGQ